MKFKIQDKTCSPRNQFQIEVLFMHGDADAFTTKMYKVGLVAHSATPCLKFFELALAKFQHGMGGDDNYRDVPGYYALGESNEVDEDGFHLYESQWDIPTSSEYCDGDAQVREIKLFYYNSEGTKFEVEYNE